MKSLFIFNDISTYLLKKKLFNFYTNIVDTIPLKQLHYPIQRQEVTFCIRSIIHSKVKSTLLIFVVIMKYTCIPNLFYTKVLVGDHFFSSPKLKAQVSFSDHLSSVVCLSVCLSVCSFVCKLFTFSSSSQEPLGQFQPNLAQSIIG